MSYFFHAFPYCHVTLVLAPATSALALVLASYYLRGGRTKDAKTRFCGVGKRTAPYDIETNLGETSNQPQKLPTHKGKQTKVMDSK